MADPFFPLSSQADIYPEGWGLAGSVYHRTNTSFSGCDIKAVVSLEGRTRIIGNMSTLSYSIHREKFPVRALGYTYPKAWTRGPRTIAGTVVFTVFDRYALYDIAKAKATIDRSLGETALSLLGDQMAPFDIVCMFQNEYGRTSQLRLLDVELVDEGQTMSVNDIYTESTHSFVAGDIDVMFPTELGPMTAKRPFLSEGVANVFTSST